MLGWFSDDDFGNGMPNDDQGSRTPLKCMTSYLNGLHKRQMDQNYTVGWMYCTKCTGM